MYILDENIPSSQQQLLRKWRIRAKVIGEDIGDKGIPDEQIITLLHGIRSVTFFTRDSDFFSKGLCHTEYCLVHLAVGQFEIASFIRRFLKHPHFNTAKKRMGKVVRISQIGLLCYEKGMKEARFVEWLP